MERKHNDRNGFDGRLPEMAPLANPYVPFQLENPPKYDARKGLVRGTLFPGLELPFMGKVNDREKNPTPMAEMQALGFAIQELALYLDTHREDMEATQLYQTYQKMYHQAMMERTKEGYPLNHFCPTEGEYRWINDPWPWEYSANKEV